MKLIIPLLLVSFSLLGQSAQYNDYTPTVKGMTVGQNYCYFWFHSAVVASGWDYEVACYSGTNNVILSFKKSGVIFDSGFDFAGGSIRFIIAPNTSDPTKYDFTVAGKGPSDLTDPQPIKVTI